MTQVFRNNNSHGFITIYVLTQKKDVLYKHFYRVHIIYIGTYY